MLSSPSVIIVTPAGNQDRLSAVESPLLSHCSTHCATVDRRQRKISIDDWKELEKKQTETNDVVFTFFQMPRTL